MADFEHLTLLKRFPEQWNDWRQRNTEQPDLSEADLAGADLRGLDLRNANLGGANLFEADLSSADLRGAKLAGANIKGAKFTGTQINAGDVETNDLTFFDLKGAHIHTMDGSRVVDSNGKVIAEESYDVLARFQAQFPGRPANEFTIRCVPELSSQQITGALTALADYFRLCGGAGLQADFELEEVLVGTTIRA